MSAVKSQEDVANALKWWSAAQALTGRKDSDSAKQYAGRGEPIYEAALTEIITRAQK